MKDILSKFFNSLLELIKAIPKSLVNYLENKSSFKKKYVHRKDKNGNHIHEGDKLLHSSGEEYKVVFAEDILAFVLFAKNGDYDYMSEWVAGDWEIIK